MNADYMDRLAVSVPTAAERSKASRARRKALGIGLAAAAKVRDTEWMVHANCRGVDPELFFPVRGASLAEARAVCAGCVVRADCLEYGLNEKTGVFGGKSERERRTIRKQRRAAS